MKRLVIFMFILSFAGCASLPVSVDTIITTVSATAKAVRPISEEEEYYVGRAVAAKILSTYALVNDQQLIEYVILIGQTAALHSEKPNTYGGYHFAVLNSDEINAFACPGGTIFITKGMIKAVKSEDELAAVLAHEVAHINHRDGISSIKQARWTEAATIIGTKAAAAYGPKELSQLVTLFEGSIDDIFKTLVVNGYGQSQELSADKAALTYLTKAGYNPQALKDFLERLSKQGKSSGGGILKTHPGTDERIENVKSNMPSEKIDPSLIAIRDKRFKSIAQ